MKREVSSVFPKESPPALLARSRPPVFVRRPVLGRRRGERLSEGGWVASCSIFAFPQSPFCARLSSASNRASNTASYRATNCGARTDPFLPPLHPPCVQASTTQHPHQNPAHARPDSLRRPLPPIPTTITLTPLPHSSLLLAPRPCPRPCPSPPIHPQPPSAVCRDTLLLLHLLRLLFSTLPDQTRPVH